MSCHIFPGQRTQFECLPNGVVICQSVFSRTLDIDSNEIPPQNSNGPNRCSELKQKETTPIENLSIKLQSRLQSMLLIQYYTLVKVKGCYKYSHTVTKYNRKPPLLPLKSGTTILSSFSAKVEDIPRMMSSIIESTGSY